MPSSTHTHTHTHTSVNNFSFLAQEFRFEQRVNEELRKAIKRLGEMTALDVEVERRLKITRMNMHAVTTVVNDAQEQKDVGAQMLNQNKIHDRAHGTLTLRPNSHTQPRSVV